MINIVKGEDKEITVRLNIAEVGPLDLTGKTISVKFLDSAASLQTKSGSIVGTAPQGRFSFSLTDTDTEGLSIGNFDFDVYVGEAGDTQIYKAIKQAKVVDRIR